MEALTAVRATFPAMKAGLEALDASERPSYDVSALVSLHLADRHREKRGYSNESVDQIAADLGIAPRKVRRVLKALDTLGLWVADGRGNQHHPTKRRPSFLEDAASGQADDALPDGAETAASAQADGAPDEQRPVAAEQRPVAASAPSGTGMSSVRLADDTPTPNEITPTSPPKELAHVTNAAEFADLVASVASEHLPNPIKRKRGDHFAADRLMSTIAASGDPHTALARVPAILGWAATQPFWASKVTTLAGIEQNWHELSAAATAALRRQERPVVTPKQQQNIDSVQRVARGLRLEDDRKELSA